MAPNTRYCAASIPLTSMMPRSRSTVTRLVQKGGRSRLTVGLGSSSLNSRPAPSASTPLMAQAIYTALKLASEIRKPPRNGATERPTMVIEE